MTDSIETIMKRFIVDSDIEKRLFTKYSLIRYLSKKGNDMNIVSIVYRHPFFIDYYFEGVDDGRVFIVKSKNRIEQVNGTTFIRKDKLKEYTIRIQILREEAMKNRLIIDYDSIPSKDLFDRIQIPNSVIHHPIMKSYSWEPITNRIYFDKFSTELYKEKSLLDRLPIRISKLEFIIQCSNSIGGPLSNTKWIEILNTNLLVNSRSGVIFDKIGFKYIQAVSRVRVVKTNQYIIEWDKHPFVDKCFISESNVIVDKSNKRLVPKYLLLPLNEYIDKMRTPITHWRLEGELLISSKGTYSLITGRYTKKSQPIHESGEWICHKYLFIFTNGKRLIASHSTNLNIDGEYISFFDEVFNKNRIMKLDTFMDSFEK